MSRTVIGFALLTIVCATVFAQGLAQSDIGNNLQGKYVRIHTESDLLVCKFDSIQKLGDRSFAVCDVIDADKKVSRAFIPIDSMKMLIVFESKEAALGETAQADNKTNVTGLVTLRGKPLNCTILFHDTKGATYSGDISEDGKYELSNIPAGTYTITFDKDNLPPKYRTVAQSQIRVDVRSGRNALDFSLE